MMRDGSEDNIVANAGAVQQSQPITISMNQKFSSDGIKSFVQEELSEYKKPIYASDYEDYVEEDKRIYPETEDIKEGMLFDLKKFGVDILICVCIYNEQAQAIEITMNGIYANLPHLQRFGIPQNKVAVVLVQDGILNCHDSVVAKFAEFDGHLKSPLKERIAVIKSEIEAAKKKGKSAGIAKNQNFPETIPKRLSLLYQNKWRPDKPEDVLKDYELNLLTCFKHKNGKKLSSHVWFFEGFCRYLKPTYCVLLDVGTVPDETGVLNLIKGMVYDKNIGGVSGFMSIDSNFESLEGDSATTHAHPKADETTQKLLGKPQREQMAANQANLPRAYCNAPKRLYQPQQKSPDSDSENKNKVSCGQCMTGFFCSVEKAQEVEYIGAHFLDKNFESFTRFLHVLPGAWSGYRLCALQTNETYNLDILQKKYFKTIFNPQSDEGEEAYKQANMYLAEDRILSLAIYCQPRKQYYLKYIPNARAKTDPMKSHFNLIMQRRRWINSSLFAFEYVLANYSYDMRESYHGVRDTIMITIGMVIAAVGSINAYLIPCFYLFVMYAILRTNDTLKYVQDTYLGQSYDLQRYTALFFSLIYVSTVVAAIGGSLNGNRWIKEAYEYDEKGEVKMKSKKGEDPVPVTRKDAINGPAIHISRIIAFFTYFLMLLIGEIIVRTILKFANSTDRTANQWIVFVLLVANAAAKLIVLLMHLPSHPREVWAYIWGWVSYLSYQGVYTHTMVIFSFCNVDDVSWGTKGATDSGEKKFAVKKMYFVSKWLFWNTVVCFVLFLLQFVLEQDGMIRDIYVLLALAIYSTVELLIKTVFAVLNHIKFYMCCCCGNREPLRSQGKRHPKESRYQDNERNRLVEMVRHESPDRILRNRQPPADTNNRDRNETNGARNQTPQRQPRNSGTGQAGTPTIKG